MKVMRLGVAIAWTCILILYIIMCIKGETPSWISMFCVTASTVMYSWVAYLDSIRHGED